MQSEIIVSNSHYSQIIMYIHIARVYKTMIMLMKIVNMKLNSHIKYAIQVVA